MKFSWKTIIAFLSTAALLPAVVFASDTNGTILDAAKWAWGENFGWINLAPTAVSSSYVGLQITDTAVAGYGWSQEYGWLNFSPSQGGVVNTCEGHLSGSAWSEQFGWIDMSGVTISATGTFAGTSGSAASTSGRIIFSCSNCSVQTDWRPCATRTPPAVCGNGIIEGSETCDDGNIVNGDGCNSSCRIETVNTGNPSGGGGDASDLQPPTITDVATSTSIMTGNVSWIATDNTAVAGCLMNVGLSTDYTAELNATASGHRFFVLVNDLSPDTIYYYRIVCSDPAHNSGTSIGSFRTHLGDNEPPVIAQVTSTPSVTSASVNWLATDNLSVPVCTLGYNVTSLQSPFSSTAPVTSSGTIYSASFSQLVPNARYFFQVQCSDEVLNSSATTSQFLTFPDNVPPADVSNFRANPRSSSALLTWDYPTNISDVSQFVIRRSTTSLPATLNDGVLAAVISNRNARQYLDTGLTNDTLYYYSIFVVDTSHNNSNGVSSNAVPYIAGDRDHDGIGDDLDLCDANNPGQVDTPVSTVVADNGCPKIIFDSSDLTNSLYSLITVQPGRLTTQIPLVLLRTPIFTAGLQPGVWYPESRNYGISFTVAPDGNVTWANTFNNIFSETRDNSGTQLTVHGFHYTIDSSAVDPRGQFRIYNSVASTRYLSEVATVSLFPKQYSLLVSQLAPFQVTFTGLITWNHQYDDLYHFANNTLTINPFPVCLRQDTLRSNYRFLSPQGQTAYGQGDIFLHLLPAWYDFGLGVFSPYNPEIQASVRPQELRNLNLFLNPLRLYDPVDGESGSLVNITINLQNVRANLGQCSEVQTQRRCGNHVLELGEQCDDGNTRNGDGCSQFCTIEVVSRCGNGILEDSEQCDDGNLLDHDGCSGICLTEAVVCGNGVIETGEECDDENTIGGDGCSASCRLERPALCGNGMVERGEQCDDGNNISRDGCSATCTTETPEQRAACSDDMDNDGDGLIDMADPGCDSPTDTSEDNALQNIHVEEVSGGVNFFLAQRTIPTTLHGGVLTSLTGDQVTVELPASLYGANTTRVDLVLFDNRYHFVRIAGAGSGTVDVTMPVPGQQDAYIEFYNGNNLTRIMRFVAESASYGTVQNSADGTRLAGATVTVLQSSGNIWPANNYRQQNPITVAESGLFGFVVPNGQYILRVERAGFTLDEVPIDVTNNVINGDRLLRKRFGSDVLDVLDGLTNGGLGALNAELQKIGKQIGVAIGAIGRFVSDPAVKSAVAHVVAPTAAAVAVVVVAPSLFNILYPLLRYLFFQPLIFVGKRKRKEWGIVYSSLTKLPIDLAMVRLVDSATNRVTQSRVTDFQGRFIFFTTPGDYRLEVKKDGFAFPSAVLATISSDGRLTDLYHGSILSIKEDGKPVSPNIPVDPSGIEKTPKRIIWENRLRFVQQIVSVAGIIVALLSFIIAPTLVTGGLFAVHLTIFVLFLKFVQPRKPKQWGVVSDSTNKKPVEKAIVRLFASEYDKLVSTQVTGAKGRYAFLVGPNTYRIIVEHPSFTQEKTPEFDLRNTEKGFVNKDVSLHPKDIVSNINEAAPDVEL